MDADAEIARRLHFGGETPLPAPRYQAPQQTPASTSGSCGTPSTSLHRPRFGNVERTPASSSQQRTDRSAHRRTPQTSSPVVRYGVPSVDTGRSKASHSSSSRVYRIPQSDSSDEEVQLSSQQLQSSHARLAVHTEGVSLPGCVGQQLQQLQLQMRQSIQVEVGQRSSAWQDAWQQAERSLQERLLAINLELKAKEEELQLADDRLKAEHRQERDQKLRQLQKLHESSAALQQQQVEKLQQQARERLQAERRAAEEAQRKQQEQQQQELARHKAEEERQVKEEQQRKAAAAAASASAAAAAPPAAAAAAAAAVAPKAAAPGQAAAPAVPSDKASAAARCMRVTPDAAKWEKQVQKRMAELEAMVSGIIANDALKKQRREIEKKMTVHVQQISATLDQIAKKCVDVFQLINAQPDPAWKVFAMLQFATKSVKQEELIFLNNKAAFPIATVIVKVSTQFPELMELMLGLLHRELVVAVPLAFVQEPGALTPAQYHRLMGYKELDGPNGSKVFESTDELLKRVEGLMLLYGAIVQVDDPANPHGLDHAWRWLARALNSLPASRLSAKAIICFLRSAGYAIHLRFRGQFIKLLKCMYEGFLPELAAVQEPDVQPLRTLLEHYLTNAQYLKEPEGRQMPRVDVSTFFDR